MSLTSVSLITGRGVPPNLHTRLDGQSNDRHPSLRHIRYFFSAMSDLAAQVSSRAWTYSPEISSYIQNGDSTAISDTLKPGLIQRYICVMAYPFAASADWLVGCSRHFVSSLLAQCLGFRFTKC